MPQGKGKIVWKFGHLRLFENWEWALRNSFGGLQLIDLNQKNSNVILPSAEVGQTD
jgi:hypothetical protein